MSRVSLLLFLAIGVSVASGQINYDEDRVPEYELPDPLLMDDGSAVEDRKSWPRRRAEVLELFRRYVYGRAPDDRAKVRFDLIEARPALEGQAVRKQVDIHCGRRGQAVVLRLLLYVPTGRAGRAPAFLGLNFWGNHTTDADPGIQLSPSWMREGRERGVQHNRATEASRGRSQSRWPVAEIVSRGYALATMYYGDIDPDFDDGFQNGVHALFHEEDRERRSDDWGSIGAWAWGLSRALDYLEADADVDGSRVAVVGHSRLGKTSLWAGARDERFALVVSNDSGCGGAALSRRRYGETVRVITTAFPHWFCGNFATFVDREDELPVDQHMLVALMAPRPVFVSSAAGDRWADPRGEFSSCLHADPVYRLLGTDGLAAKEMPEPGARPVLSRIGYHHRRGKHDLTITDWTAFLDFADNQGLAPSRPPARHVYKTAGKDELALHVFSPVGHTPEDRRPAIVFFFGGGWNGGSPKQFYPHCQHLAARGMVAISAEYRVKKRHGTSPFECVSDGKSALRWLRQNAGKIGIDPGRIAAGGGSAGGHVAAAVATVPGLDDPSDDLSVSPRPHALVLFNPVYDNGPAGYGHERVADRYLQISPAHNIREGMCPAIVFLGTKDTLIRVETAEAFRAKMRKAGSRSDLHLYEGRPHGFFNQGRGDGQDYLDTVRLMDEFLISLGFL